MGKTNKKWHSYKEMGAYYKLEDGVLLTNPMLADGSMEGPDADGIVGYEVAFGQIDEDVAERCLAIAKKLESME